MHRSCNYLSLTVTNVLIFVLSLTLTVVYVRTQAPLDFTDTFHSVSSEADESSNGVIIDCSENDDTCKQDQVALDAIRTLHRNIDDDQNGNVDLSESDEFMRDELQYTDGFERQSIFHGDDKLISVGDLWQAWRKSTVYNWTVDDVVEWLEIYLELPQYVKLFQQNEVDGPKLPRLAVNDQHYMSVVLGIKNPVHRQKLSLKATDIVLFGSPKKGHSFKKDLALVVSLLIALLGCWMAYIQHKRSQVQMKKMIKDLDSLQKAGESLTDLQVKLDQAQQEQLSATQEKKKLEEKYREDIVLAKNEAERLKQVREGTTTEEINRLKLAEEELAQVRGALRKTEKELELRSSRASPTELQAWLQLTHEIDLMHFTVKRQAVERQFASVKEGCEKIRKKRTSFMGSLRMAHSSSIDDIDQKIVAARAAMEEVRHDLQERLQRWHTIEGICGFPIIINPGMTVLKQAIKCDGSGRTSVIAPVTIDEEDEDLPPSYPTATAMILHSDVNGSTRSPPPYQVYTTTTRPAQTEVFHHPHTIRLSGSLDHLHVPSHKSEHHQTERPVSASSVENVSFQLGERSPVRPNSDDVSFGSSHDVSESLSAKGDLLTVGNAAFFKSLSFSTAPSSNHSHNTHDTKIKDKHSHSESDILEGSKFGGINEENSGTESTGSDDRKKEKRTMKKKFHVFAKFLRKESEKP